MCRKANDGSCLHVPSEFGTWWILLFHDWHVYLPEKIKGQFCLRVGESQIGINTAQHNTTQERVRVRGMEGKKTREEVEKSGMIDTWMWKHRLIYTGATKHPFILSIRDGTVDLEAFKTWLVGFTFSFTYYTFCSAIFHLCFYTLFEFALSLEPLS